MKKNLTVCALIALMLIPTFAQAMSTDETSQVLVPKEMYVGDTAEIQYSFRSAVDFFVLADEKMVKGDTLTLNLSSMGFSSLADACTVNRATLSRSDLNYTLVISITPWKPGTIDFAPFDLDAACRATKNAAGGVSPGDEVHFYIDLAPVVVSSLSEKMGVTTLKPPVPPLTVPGTNYIVWLLVILLLILLVVVGAVIVKLPSIIKKWGELRTHAGFIKNARVTKRRLRRLCNKQGIDDKQFALRWQQIMRVYLEYRFATSFATIPSSKITAVIDEVTGGMFSETQQNAIDDIASLFVRTDYIRFATGSIDSQLLPLQEHQTSFMEKERDKIIDRSQKSILILEKNEDETTDDHENGPEVTND